MNEFKELNEFINAFLQKIGQESSTKIKEVLVANNFTSRLSLKLLSPDNLDKLFADAKLPLGSRKVLEYHLNLLHDESPLHLKKKITNHVEKEKGNTNNSSSNSSSESENGEEDNPIPRARDNPTQSSQRALFKRRLEIEKQIEADEQSLSELQVNLDSMNINVPSLPAIGIAKVTCGNCHHRGHRNQVNQPCNLQKCTSYTYCGLREKHPEYFSEMNKLKLAIKKKRDNIKAHQEQLNGIKNFISQSEHQFLKALTPRMIKVDPSYKLNKQKLLRDIRILRKFYNGKIPAETTNDAEQLKISLQKCKQTLEREVGEVAVHGIQEYEQLHCDNAEKSAINLNVTMSVSPDNITNHNNVSDVGVVHSNSKIDKQKSGKARKLVFKHKRKSRKSKIKERSSSSSESDSESECSSDSTSDDSNRSRRGYISKKKRKKSSRQRRHRRKGVDVSNNRITGFGERNPINPSNQNFLATQVYDQNQFAPPSQSRMILPSTSQTSYYGNPAYYYRQHLPTVNAYSNPFSCNWEQWATSPAPFTAVNPQDTRSLDSHTNIPLVSGSCEQNSTQLRYCDNTTMDNTTEGLSLLSSAVEFAKSDA